MPDRACDFGTSNTVLAGFHESTGRAETIEIPGITSAMRYRFPGETVEHVAWVTPSLIHYGEKETLIGDQVVSRGLVDHPDTFRWMKRGIAYSGKKKKTSQGYKSPQEAGADFLRRLLDYAASLGRVNLAEDAFTFTAPVEAFQNFQDWLWRLAEDMGIPRLRLLDEATAAIFGYHGAARRDDRFLIVDFGGGTLDVSVVRIELDAAAAGNSGRRAVQLGQAGADLGGMNIDSWIAEDFCRRHRLTDADRRELEAAILRQAEDVKMRLSDLDETDAELTVLNDSGGAARLLRTAYTRHCPACTTLSGGRPRNDSTDSGCLGCIFGEREFTAKIRKEIRRALINACAKTGMAEDDITKILVTGGTSLIPLFRKLIEEEFPGKVEYSQPFDCVVRGACRGVVIPILQHRYAVRSFNKAENKHDLRLLFDQGTQYPTPVAMPKWARGAVDGATRIGLDIYEVSQIRLQDFSDSVVDANGVIRDARITSKNHYVWLNSDSRTFIVADPPYSAQRDKERFLCRFSIDGNRRLLVTAVDNLTEKTLLKDHVVVRL